MTEPKPTPKPTSIRLPDDLRQAIERRAADDDRSFNSMVIKLLKAAIASDQRREVEA